MNKGKAKIEEFSYAYAQFFKKQNELKDIVHALEGIEYNAEYALNELIDNNLDKVDLLTVHNEYNVHKFSSPIICNFMKEVGELLLCKLDNEMRQGIEATSIMFVLSHPSTIIMPFEQAFECIQVSFIDKVGYYAFNARIPIRGGVHLDFTTWNVQGNGMYIVEAMNLRESISPHKQRICQVFSHLDAANAISDLINGRLDETLLGEELLDDTAVSTSSNFTYSYDNVLLQHGFNDMCTAERNSRAKYDIIDRIFHTQSPSNNIDRIPAKFDGLKALQSIL